MQKVLFVHRPWFEDSSNPIVSHGCRVCHRSAVRVRLRRTFDSELKMEHQFYQLDPWSHTLAMIDRSSGLRLSDPRSRPESKKRRGAVRQASRDGRKACATIRILERLSTSTVSLSWRDPTSINYGEQVWWMGCARKGGHCAVSGERIVRGQSIYRPKRSGQGTPLNKNAMILTSVILRACPSPADVHEETRIFSVESD
jgi:hypothetical protein